VVDERSNGDRVAAFSGYQLRQVVADWRVEPNLTAFDLLQDRGSGEGLTDTADAVLHVRGNGAAGADISNASGASPYLTTVAHLGEYSRHSRAMDALYGRVQFRGIEWVLYYVYLLVVGLLFTTPVRAPIGVSIFWNRHVILLMSFEYLSRDLMSAAELLGTSESHPVTNTESGDHQADLDARLST
jgi:hypothetical protein